MTVEKIVNVMIGLPGSGKSTFCKEACEEPEAHWISRDAIRFDILKPNESYFSQETNVFNSFIATANYFLEKDEDMILYIDATHINASSRLKLLRRLNLKGDEEINYYVNTHEPDDKAGAYGLQGIAGMFIEKINGNMASVIGLPTCDLYKILKKERLINLNAK